MEATKAERIRLGVFLLCSGLIIVAIAAFYFGKHLTDSKVMYYTRFPESVDGLVAGAHIKWSGVLVGNVERIYMDEKNLSQVVVEYRVNPNTPIKASVRATLVGGFSITGMKSIELAGGNPSERNLAPGGEILAGTSRMKQLTGQTEVISLKVEALLDNLLEATNEKNLAHWNSSLEKMDQISSDLQGADIAKTSNGIHLATKAIESAAKRADLMFYRSQENLTISLQNIREASENLTGFTRALKDNPSLLLRREEKQGRSE